MYGLGKSAVQPAERLECVVHSRDWVERVARRPGAALPRGWSEIQEDKVRYDLLRGGPGTQQVPGAVDADVAFLDTSADVRWAVEFAEHIRDPVWAASLRLFDAGVVLGRPMPGTEGVPLRACGLRRTERQARNSTGRFVAGWEKGYRFRVAAAPGVWPLQPRGWAAELEVPYHLWAGVPVPVLLWGLRLAHPSNGFRSREELAPAVWALWSAVHTLFLQDVLSIFLDEMRQGRLFWLPPRVVEEARRLGLHALCRDDSAVRALRRGLAAVRCVRWDRVDPAVTTRPVRNDHGGRFSKRGTACHGMRPMTGSRLYRSCYAVGPCPRMPSAMGALRGTSPAASLVRAADWRWKVSSSAAGFVST